MMGLVTTKMQTLEIVLRVIVGIITGIATILSIYDDWQKPDKNWLILGSLMDIFVSWIVTNILPSAIALFIEMYVIK